MLRCVLIKTIGSTLNVAKEFRFTGSLCWTFTGRSQSSLFYENTRPGSCGTAQNKPHRSVKPLSSRYVMTQVFELLYQI